MQYEERPGFFIQELSQQRSFIHSFITLNVVVCVFVFTSCDSFCRISNRTGMPTIRDNGNGTGGSDKLHEINIKINFESSKQTHTHTKIERKRVSSAQRITYYSPFNPRISMDSVSQCSNLFIYLFH